MWSSRWSAPPAESTRGAYSWLPSRNPGLTEVGYNEATCSSYRRYCPFINCSIGLCQKLLSSVQHTGADHLPRADTPANKPHLKVFRETGLACQPPSSSDPGRSTCRYTPSRSHPQSHFLEQKNHLLPSPLLAHSREEQNRWRWLRYPSFHPAVQFANHHQRHTAHTLQMLLPLRPLRPRSSWSSRVSPHVLAITEAATHAPNDAFQIVRYGLFTKANHHFEF